MQKDMAVQVTLNGVDRVSPKIKGVIDKVSELTKRLAVSKNAINGLEMKRAQILSVGEMQQKIKKLSTELKIAELNAQMMGRKMLVGDATKKDLKKATDAVEELRGRFSKLSQSALAVRQSLNAAGIGNLTAGLATIDAQIAQRQAQMAKAGDQLRKLRAAEKSAERMRSTAGSLSSAGVGMVIPGYAITRGLGEAVSESSQFNGQLRQIAITSDMTDAAMKALGRTIMRTSDLTGQGTDALTGGIGFLIAAGASPGVAQRSISTIGQVATAYKAEIEDIAAASFVMNDALGIAPEKLKGALGIAAMAGKNGSVELRDMAKVLPVLGSGMVALKVTGNEAVATIGAALQIARKGAPTADIAANNMQNFLTKVMSPETLKKAEENFGLDLYKVITDAQKKGGNPIEAALDAIGKVTKGGDQKLLGDLFQDMQVQGFLRPMLQNMDEYRRIKAEALGAASGSLIDQDFAKSARDMDVSTARLANAWKNLKITVGNALAPALQPVVAMLSRATVAMVGFAERNPRLASALAILVGVLGALLLVGGGLALTVAAILIPLAGLTVMAGVLGVGLLPLVGIVLGIGAAVAVIVGGLYYFRDGISAVFSSIASFFTEAYDLIAGGRWAELGSFLVTSIIDGVLITLGALFTLAWSIPATFWRIIMETNWTELGAAILKGIANGLWSGLEFVVGAMLGIADKIKGSFKTAFGINSPSRVFFEYGGHTTAGLALGITRGTPAAVESVRRMAAGITVAGAATLGAGVAMAGPSAPGAPGAGSGAVTFGPVTIAINGTGMDPEAIAKAVDQRLRAMATQTKTEQQARFFDD